MKVNPTGSPHKLIIQYPEEKAVAINGNFAHVPLPYMHMSSFMYAEHGPSATHIETAFTPLISERSTAKPL